MKCPICKAPTIWEGNPDRPFCSERCRIIDLGNWSAEDYRVEMPLQDVEENAEVPQD
jgi:endogenous inhibitor of DNA gyrase (YacG/DUF329 family)